MLKDIERVQDKVELLLERHGVLRDDDKLLWLAYLVYFHNLRPTIGEEAYEKLKSLLMEKGTPTMESIRRVRQKFQEAGKYVGTKRKEKLKEAGKVRDWALENPIT